MTPTDSAIVQAYAAVAQTLVAIVIGICTVKYASLANKIYKLQAETQIGEPAVSLDLYPRPYRSIGSVLWDGCLDQEKRPPQQH